MNSFLSLSTLAEELKPVVLPAPQMKGGMPLMKALRERQSQRAFAPEPLPAQVLSNLLWAAWGINRPDSGRRTVPTAMNRQQMDVYVVLPEGAYLYDAKAHHLTPVAAGDFRTTTGGQDFVRSAPVNLVYVSRADAGTNSNQTTWDGAHAGAMAQNVYLFCASEKLATVVRGSVNHEEMGKVLKLVPGQRVVLAQRVGHPSRRN
jgi:nitroreductase